MANVAYNNNYICATGYNNVWGGYNATIITANGYTVTSTLPPRWNTMN